MDEFKLRLSEALKADLQEIADFWTALNDRIEQPEKVSLNEVILRLCSVGRDGVWAEYGKRPTTKHEREELLTHVAASYKKSKKSE